MTTGTALALLSAVAYGASAFAGGLLSRQVHYAVVGLVSQSVSMAAILIVAKASSAPALGTHQVLWGIGAGLGGGVGVLALYRGLAGGQMSVAGPLSAVGAAGIPVLVDLLFGGRLSPITTAGVAAAIPGIWLVSGSGRGARAGVVAGSVAGGGFAVQFVGLHQVGGQSGLWAVAVSQAATMVAVAVAVLVQRPAGPRPGIAAAVPGLLGSTGTMLYFLATQHTSLTVAVVLTSLYPAVTIALASLVLRERITGLRGFGLVLCACAVWAFLST